MNDPYDEREPAYDLTAEQNVLGAMMVDESVIPAVFGVLDEQPIGSPLNRFFRPAHQMIYHVIIDIWDKGTRPDATVVGAELIKRGEINRVGGGPYLFELISSDRLPTTSNAATYAGIVHDRWRDRERRRLAERLIVADHEHARDLVTEWLGLDVATGQPGVTLPGQTWRPADLRAVLSGEVPKVEPAVGLTRTDGVRLLYAGKEHTVLGEMECGKSWFSAASCAAELTAGHHVLYVHFEESDPTDTVERLLALGVPAHIIGERFRFVGPLEPVRPEYLAALLDPAPSLVVLDGVNEAMALHGQGIREEDGAAAFRRVLVKPCTSVEAAVLACDHVVKDREARGRSPLGSIHKGNGINGSLIMLENVEPFGRHSRGYSHVFITKDRPGQLRQHGRPTKLAGKTFMGSLVVDDMRTKVPHLDLKFWAPNPESATEGPVDDPRAVADRHVFDIVKELAEAGHRATGRAIRAKSGYSTDNTLDALERLAMNGLITKTKGSGNSHIYAVAPEPIESEKTEPEQGTVL